MKKTIRGFVLIIILGAFFYVLDARYDLIQIIKEQNIKFTLYQEKEEFVKQVRAAMLEGTERVTLFYFGKIDDLWWFTQGAVTKAYGMDDAADSGDYDYLKFKLNTLSAKIAGLGRFQAVIYQYTYNESVSETQAVDEKINVLFKKWNIDEMSDYEKVRKIHDYIIKNASYDSSLQNYSAYDNLIKQSSTCQGYMCAAYKMLTKAGIPCRIISGTGNGQSHGWNIVKLNGKWYNIDCTWDDPVTFDGEGILLYDYFLKSDQDFGDHVKDPEYGTEEFKKSYPISPVSYGE